MTLQQIRYLVCVIESGSISEAAKRLYVAQSSISSAIKDIESEYDITIFKRNSKGVVLTREGEELVVDLERVMNQIEFIEDKYSKKRHANQRFGISSQHHVCGSDAFLKLLDDIKDTDYRVGFLECRTHDVLDNVEKGISDIGIIFYTKISKRAMTQELRKKDLIFNRITYQKPHIYVRKGHPLCEKSVVHSLDVVGYPFVTYEQTVNSSSIFTETVIPYHKINQIICISDRAAAYSTLRSMNAFLVGSGHISSDSYYNDIVSIPIQDAENIEIGWISKNKYALSDIASKYINLLMDELN